MRIIKKYTLLTLVGIFALTGCGKAAQNTQEDVNSASDATHLDADFKKNFDTIELNGSTYKLPMEYSIMEELGFSDSMDPAAELTKGKPVATVFSDEAGREITGYIAYAGSGESGYKIDSKVIAILASKETAKDLGLKFYKGISLDSTEAEVAAVLDHMQSGDNGALYGIRMGDYEYLSVSLKDGSVNDIMVINGTDFFGHAQK